MTQPTPICRHALGAPTRQRGAATLVVVMVLFFIMALVAVYTSRNLIFEQRTSSNQYRATQAFEAAEAGVDWALAMLNGGRIDTECMPTTDETFSTFRARYIENIDAASNITIRMRPIVPPAVVAPALLPSCAYEESTNSWKCHCPIDSATALPAVAGSAPKPMFRVRFEYLTSTRRDVVRIVSAGCNRPDANCLSETPTVPPGDAISVVTAAVALRNGLSTPPGAAITAKGDINAGAGPLRAINTNLATNGVTFLAGGAVLGTAVPVSLPGTPGEASIGEADATLAGLLDGNRMFSAVFGMTRAMYRVQPGAVRIDCSATCTSSTVNARARENPGRVLWLDGNLNVNGDIGTAPVAGPLLASEVPPSGPLMLVVEGTATLSSGTVYGVLYGRVADWDRGAGNAQVRGALVAEGNLVGSGSQQVTYDADIVNFVRTRSGSFVRVPGGWKDF